MTKKQNPMPHKVTASIAVLSALAGGGDTIAMIASGTRMTEKAVQQCLMRLRIKEHAKRTNKKGFAVIGTFKITPEGRQVLRKAQKEVGL
jgi:hypothetical protein